MTTHSRRCNGNWTWCWSSIWTGVFRVVFARVGIMRLRYRYDTTEDPYWLAYRIVEAVLCPTCTKTTLIAKLESTGEGWKGVLRDLYFHWHEFTTIYRTTIPWIETIVVVAWNKDRSHLILKCNLIMFTDVLDLFLPICDSMPFRE